MIKEITMFTVLCDNCNKDVNEDKEYSCWNDKEFAEDVAIDDDWIKEDDKHYCPDCFTYNDDDNIVIKENLDSTDHLKLHMDIQDVLRILKNGSEKPKDELNDYMKGKRDGQVEAYSHAWTLVKNLSVAIVSENKPMDEEYPLIPMKDIEDEARLIAVRWHENATDWIGDKHKLASDIMNYARRK